MQLHLRPGPVPATMSRNLQQSIVCAACSSSASVLDVGGIGAFSSSAPVHDDVNKAARTCDTGRTVSKDATNQHCRRAREVHDVSFAISPTGKPLCSHASYSVSHDGRFYAVAVCVAEGKEGDRGDAALRAPPPPVGVDVVDCRRHVNVNDFAPFFDAEELRSASENRAEFFRIWARKEAESKVGGEGLWRALRPRRAVDGADDRSGFCHEIVQLDDDHICAVAMRTRDANASVSTPCTDARRRRLP